METITCYGQTIGRTFCQEWYETASGDAGKRARLLRKAGFRVVTSSMGEQVTGLGRIKMSMVSFWYAEGGYDNIPPVRIERLR